jgi:hypothetical protein
VFPSFVEIVPLGHATQSATLPLPPTLRYVFRGHAVHTLDPAAAHQPSVHAVQFPDRCSENFPIAQVAHTVAPVKPSGDEKVPAPHASHTVFRAATFEAVPTAHLTQSVSTVSLQAVHPGSRLYLPARHWMHGPPWGPHHPGTHEQFSRLHAPATLNVPPEHCASWPP